MISDRTKNALAEKKKLGFTLGSPANLTPEAIESGQQVRQLNARVDENNRRAAALASSMRAGGQSWTAIASALNGYGFRTRRGVPTCPGAARGGALHLMGSLAVDFRTLSIRWNIAHQCGIPSATKPCDGRRYFSPSAAAVHL